METDTKKAIAEVIKEKRTYTVAEIADILQIGKSKAYELCNMGLFRSIRIGRSLRVLKVSFDDWFNNQ